MNKMIREKHLYTYPIKIKNPIKISILYPNTYFIGMSNLGFQALYHNFNMNSNYKLSRFFFDKNRENSIYSPDKEFNLNQSDIILISQSFELDIFNIFKMLINNNIEPYKSLRKQKPIIGIGGIFPTINPYIYKDIMDIIFKGELENYINNIHEILNTYHSVLNNEIVDYINENLSKFETSSVYTINKDSIPIHSAILSNHTSFKDMLLIEISRGCKYNCSFCLVTNIYKKYRCYYIDRIIQIVKKGLYYTNKIGLVSALTTEYPQLKELVNKINKLGGTVSFSSLRVDQIDDELYNLMKINSQHTLTIAPESSSKKIKKNIGKDINNDKIFRIVEKSPKYGIKKIKIYFIIGFENETDEDIMKNIQFIKS